MTIKKNKFSQNTLGVQKVCVKYKSNHINSYWDITILKNLNKIDRWPDDQTDHLQCMWSHNSICFALSQTVSEMSANLCFCKFISMAAISKCRENLIAAVEASQKNILIWYFLFL